MKIAIVGTGQVAAALGKGWAARGHMVTFASVSYTHLTLPTNREV